MEIPGVGKTVRAGQSLGFGLVTDGIIDMENLSTEAEGLSNAGSREVEDEIVHAGSHPGDISAVHLALPFSEPPR